MASAARRRPPRKSRMFHAQPSQVQRLVQWMRDGTREEAAADGASLLQVTRCLANLLVLGGCREQLLGCGGLRALLRVAEAVSALGGDEGGGGAHEGAPPPPEADDTLSAVARALANLTYDEQMAGEAVRAGVLAPLVAMLKREDAHHLQQEALMAIVNITAANAADAGRGHHGWRRSFSRRGRYGLAHE